MADGAVLGLLRGLQEERLVRGHLLEHLGARSEDSGGGARCAAASGGREMWRFSAGAQQNFARLPQSDALPARGLADAWYSSTAAAKTSQTV